MRRILTALLLSTATAYAQPQAPIQQSGVVTPGHGVMWTTTGVVQDAGTAAAGLLSGIGVIGSGPTICANSAPTTGAYNQVCIGAVTNTGAIIYSTANGGATGNGVVTTGGNLNISAGTNSALGVTVTNSTSGASAQTQVAFLNNLGNGAGFNLTSSTFTPFGAVAAGDAYMFSQTNLAIIANAASGAVKIAAGSNTETARFTPAGGFNVGATTNTASGVINAANGYSSGGTAGVNCSGSPTGSFASVNGIVTHC
jgi:hypothetical protein